MKIFTPQTCNFVWYYLHSKNKLVLVHTNKKVCDNVKNKLQKLRWEKGISQTQLSKESGIKQQMISSIENNQLSSPSVKTALKLARALKVSVEDIFEL